MKMADSDTLFKDRNDDIINFYAILDFNHNGHWHRLKKFATSGAIFETHFTR